MGMICGIDIFRERFRDFSGSMVLIGGAACDDWFSRVGLQFRATKDLDVVLLLEAVNPGFVAAMRKFIGDGGYEIRQRGGEGRRFSTVSPNRRIPGFPPCWKFSAGCRMVFCREMTKASSRFPWARMSTAFRPFSWMTPTTR